MSEINNFLFSSSSDFNNDVSLFFDNLVIDEDFNIIDNTTYKKRKNNYFILNREKWNEYLRIRYSQLTEEQKQIIKDKAKEYFKNNKEQWNKYINDRYHSKSPEEKKEMSKKNLEYRQNLTDEKKQIYKERYKNKYDTTSEEYKEKKKLYNERYRNKQKEINNIVTPSIFNNMVYV